MGIDWTGVVQRDFAQRTETTTSIAIPIRKTRKISLQMETGLGPFDFQGGALWSGSLEVGNTFQLMADESLDDRGDTAGPDDVLEDTVKDEDTFGYRAKLTWQKGRWNWYGQGAYMGLVAKAGPTSIPTFTGWNLKDSGLSNQMNALTGLAVSMGNWQVGPNFLWQKPIVGPMLANEDLAGTAGRTRNPLSDPFAVRENRETTAAELMITFDPTPATWMWSWDNDVREDASFASSVGFIYRYHHTTADAAIFVSDESLLLPFGGGTPSRGLWEVNCRILNSLGRNTRMSSSVYFGTAEPDGDDLRLLHRFGAITRIAWPVIAIDAHVKVNDWGPTTITATSI